jgi:ribonuclease Z
MDLTRKQFLAASGATAGALWAGNALGITGAGGPEAAAAVAAAVASGDPDLIQRARELMQNLWYMPVEDLAKDEIRVSFMGTAFVPRVNQACNSVFIEVGTGQSFVFDLGMGTIAKYTAMGVTGPRMRNVFITHLHADHMSDLTALYCFGPAHAAVTPLHVYGPSGPRLKGALYADQGTKAFCEALYTMCTWHRESMSFLYSGLKPTAEYPSGTSAWEIVAHEFDYRGEGRDAIAYQDDDVTITHFPAAHDRDGSVSYKLEFKGQSVVFSGDTKPTTWMTTYAKGVDVLIHEMALTVEDWVTHQADIHPGDSNYPAMAAASAEVQANSHSPEKAFGQIMAACKPRLGVITHCHFNQDTLVTALQRVSKYYDGPLAWAIDTMVLNLRPGQDIRQRMGLIPEFGWDLMINTHSSDELQPPKYKGPYAQFSDFTMNHIPPAYKKWPSDNGE